MPPTALPTPSTCRGTVDGRASDQGDGQRAARRLTPVGRRLADLPIDPRLALCSERPQPCAAKQHSARAECEHADNVEPRTNAAISENCHSVAHSVGDRRQRARD